MSKFELHDPIYFVSYLGNKVNLNKKYCQEINVTCSGYLIDGVWFTDESKIFKTAIEAIVDATVSTQFSLLTQYAYLLKNELAA